MKDKNVLDPFIIFNADRSDKKGTHSQSSFSKKNFLFV